MVVVIPKPNHTNPSLPKNYQPISLLECMGKLLEKIISSHLLYDINKYELIPSSQFGGRNASSTVNVGLTLQHDIHMAHASGLVCGMLLFNISGFFNNINHHHLVTIFKAMGFLPQLVSWLKSFLTDCHVSLRFNNYNSDPYNLLIGTPQGSPISLVLSTIFATPILYLTTRWINTSLSMYVNNGNLFACRTNFTQVVTHLHKAY